jgi:hypothetical protein
MNPDEVITEEISKVCSDRGYGVTPGDAERILSDLRADGFDITAP